MPTIIDSLLFHLGLDTKDFDKSRAKVDKSLKETAQKGEQGFKDMAEAATKFFAVLGGTYAVKRFIEDQIEANSYLQRFSRNLEESAQNISAWGNATERAGGSSKGLQGSLDMLSRAQTELMLTGQSGLVPFFSALGVSMADASGKALPVTKILLQLADKFQGMDRKTAFNMARMMGLDEGTTNLLIQGRREVEIAISRQKEFRSVSNDQANEAEIMRQKIVDVKQGFEAFGRSLMTDATPFLQQALNLFLDFSDWCKNNKDFVESFLKALAFELGAIALAAMPINLTVIALTALGAAIALVWNDFETWRKSGNSFIDWAKYINLATDALERLKSALHSVIPEKAWNFMSNAISSAGKIISPDESDRSKFIRIASQKLGVPENAIDAQLRNETGALGKQTIGNFNYGNIKAGSKYSGMTVSRLVRENGYSENASFRSYRNVDEAANDYANFIANRFPSAIGARNAVEYAQSLKNGGYATDPGYVSKITDIANGIANSGASTSNYSRNVSTNIGAVNVYTTSSDGDGIAQDVGHSLDYLFTSQANAGAM